MSIADAFPLDVKDSCGNFFGTALRAFNPPIPSDAKVLEIGCAEFNWLDKAAASWPAMSFTGVDWRKATPIQPNTTAISSDVMKVDLFEARTFDWIVSISAIEHVGLGHYAHDPQDPMGDQRAVLNAWRWLKPGGWFYFDVPWNSAGYMVCGTSHRIYDDAALHQRFLLEAFWAERWRGHVATDKCHVLLTETPALKGDRFYYVGLWLQKV